MISVDAYPFMAFSDQSFVMSDEFSVRVTKITSRIGVS